MVVGVGIGGDFEGCALLAKQALCRRFPSRNPKPFYAQLEEELLERINRLNIGPQGFGGKTTAFAVNVEAGATHIAGLPVAGQYWLPCYKTSQKNFVNPLLFCAYVL